MCTETDFTQLKVIFIQLLESPIPPFCNTVCCCSVTKWSDGGIVEAQRAEKKCIFEAP